MDADFYQNAQDWLAAGLSLIPIAADASKAPATKYLPKEDGKPSWNCYRNKHVENEVLCDWLKHPIGLGIIGGTISGNLVIFDFDEPMLAQNFLQVASKDRELADIAFNLPQVSTPNDGTHLYLRCTEAVGGSQKLAYNANHKTRIETKAEGGYVLAPGCPKACHPNKKTYVLMRGNLSAIPVVTPETLEAFYRIAKLFDEQPPPEEQVVREKALPSKNGHKRPGDEFNQRGDLDTLLLNHGWQKCGATLNKQLWKRPGKNAQGISATSNYADTGLFYVFSTNAHPFAANRAYTKFATFAMLEHSGIYAQAASALNKLGYGDPLPASMPIKRASKPMDDIEEEDPDRIYPRTDTGNAERFVRDWKNDVRYCRDIGQWFIWNAGKWEQDIGAAAVMRLAIQTTRKIYSEAQYGKDKDECLAIAKWAASSENVSKLKAMLEIAKNDKKLEVYNKDLDAQPWLLNVANGIINLNTGQLFDHDPCACLTRQVNIVYDEFAEAPRWEAFLEKVLPDEAVRTFVARAAGYALTGDISEQCLFFLYGGGRNGKSTFIETLSALLGEYWTKTRAQTIMIKRSESSVNNDIAALRGRRLVTVSEVNDGQRLDEALIKDLTGGDAISARFLHAEFFTFNPLFKLFLHGNHKPQVRGNDAGVWRRIKLIPFEVAIAEKDQDKHLPEKLKKELPGILNWAIKGCLQWQEVGLAAPDEVARATAEYREEMDVLAPFFADCCTLEREGRCIKTELWSAYKEWAEKNEEKLFETAKGFNHCVKGHEGIKEDRSHGKRIWKGISLGVKQDLFSENKAPEGDGASFLRGENELEGASSSKNSPKIQVLDPISISARDLLEKETPQAPVNLTGDSSDKNESPDEIPTFEMDIEDEG